MVFRPRICKLRKECLEVLFRSGASWSFFISVVHLRGERGVTPGARPQWLGDDGLPMWRPESSLQSMALFEAIDQYPIGPERDHAVRTWAIEFKTFNIDFLIDNYKKSVIKKASPIRGIRRKNREDVAWYSQELQFIEPMRHWWHQWVDARAEHLRVTLGPR